MKLYIKNMVCRRCKIMVHDTLVALGHVPATVELGEVTLGHDLDEAGKARVSKALGLLGFELIDDRKSRTIQKIKTLIVDLVHHGNANLKTNLSQYLAEELAQDYSALSNLFSEVEGITVEQYFISQRIEKVKELLMYDELSLGEIADMLNFSTGAHLSNQFKKVTGFTPSYYRNLKDKKRKQIDDI